MRIQKIDEWVSIFLARRGEYNNAKVARSLPQEELQVGSSPYGEGCDAAAAVGALRVEARIRQTAGARYAQPLHFGECQRTINIKHESAALGPHGHKMACRIAG